MTDMQTKQRFEIGIIGLGVMGRNLVLNMAEHGFSVGGYDKDPDKVEALRKESADRDIYATENMADLIGLLRLPRAVLLLVPAGAPVDSVINDLLEHVQPGDLIIDAGNSHFKDTNLRARNLAEKGIQFLGVGISGGEEGARRGLSIMPGGQKEAYERVRPLFEAIAAKVNGDPCVSWLGPASAGHYVKMVHNGIEYGVMQLIAESYDLMKRGLGLNNDALHDVYNSWNSGELKGYLMEITGRIFGRVDEKTGQRLIDEIRDVARQKGTGMWTSQSAMEMHVPVPTIDLAIAMRDLSAIDKQRERIGALLQRPMQGFGGDRDEFLIRLRRALHVGLILTYVQGLALLTVASEKYEYHLDLKAVARIWRGGCIIRTALLEDIRTAYRNQPGLPNLLLDPEIWRKVVTNEEKLRHIVCTAVELGVPVPGLMTALSYLDSCRSVWLPMNLIQAQRDYFGAHTYERFDADGVFHTEWEKW